MLNIEIKKTRLVIKQDGFLKRAKDEARTRDNQLGRLELYQLSYFRIKNSTIKNLKLF